MIIFSLFQPSVIYLVCPKRNFGISESRDYWDLARFLTTDLVLLQKSRHMKVTVLKAPPGGDEMLHYEVCKCVYVHAHITVC